MLGSTAGGILLTALGLWLRFRRELRARANRKRMAQTLEAFVRRENVRCAIGAMREACQAESRLTADGTAVVRPDLSLRVQEIRRRCNLPREREEFAEKLITSEMTSTADSAL